MDETVTKDNIPSLKSESSVVLPKIEKSADVLAGKIEKTVREENAREALKDLAGADTKTTESRDDTKQSPDKQRQPENSDLLKTTIPLSVSSHDIETVSESDLKPQIIPIERPSFTAMGHDEHHEPKLKSEDRSAILGKSEVPDDTPASEKKEQKQETSLHISGADEKQLQEITAYFQELENQADVEQQLTDDAKALQAVNWLSENGNRLLHSGFVKVGTPLLFGALTVLNHRFALPGPVPEILTDGIIGGGGALAALTYRPIAWLQEKGQRIREGEGGLKKQQEANENAGRELDTSYFLSLVANRPAKITADEMLYWMSDEYIPDSHSDSMFSSLERRVGHQFELIKEQNPDLSEEIIPEIKAGIKFDLASELMRVQNIAIMDPRALTTLAGRVGRATAEVGLGITGAGMLGNVAGKFMPAEVAGYADDVPMYGGPPIVRAVRSLIGLLKS